MATVWMRSKTAKLKRDAIAAHIARPFDATPKPRPATYDHAMVKVLEPGNYVMPEGKRHSRIEGFHRDYGCGRKHLAVALDPSMYATGSVLLRRGRVVAG